jgi:ATP-dependent DNA helicase RecG
VGRRPLGGGEGRQAYVVCPLVEDSDKIEAASATGEFERLREVFPICGLGLLHGQLASKEKESVMEAFRRGDRRVGGDHRDRGRDRRRQRHRDRDRGRGPIRALPAPSAARPRRSRARAGDVHPAGGSDDRGRRAAHRGDGRASTDGFRLAEIDLAIRGQGTVFGERQSGLGDLRMADIVRDFELLVEARDVRRSRSWNGIRPLTGVPELRDELTALLGDEVAWLFVS